MGTADVVLSVIAVFVGCQVNLYALELVVRDPVGKSLGVALTFLQFLGCALGALPALLADDRPRRPFAILWHMKANPLSPRLLAGMALLFYLTSVANNVVYDFGVSVPIHSVFRSSSLVVSMAIGFLARGVRYSALQVVCCLCVTVGVGMLSLLENNRQTSQCGGNDQRCEATSGPSASLAASAGDQFAFLCGICVLCFTTVGGGVLGQVQGSLFADAKRRHPEVTDSWKFALFWSHTVPQLMFAVAATVSDASFFGGGLWGQLGRIPAHLVGPIGLNVASQFICIRGVYSLVDSTSPVTMTFVITLRKFSSVVVSAVMFGHIRHYAAWHYVAFALVFVGGSVYPFLKTPPAKTKNE